jgi:disulfide bond formation protein DsbB
MSLPSYRATHFLGLSLCIAALLFAVLFLQGRLGLEPCPLCVVDRVIVISLGLVFLVAVLHDPGRLGQRIYAALMLLISATGIAAAARHVWLQHLPADKVPECGPGLGYMLDVFGLSQTLKMVLSGSGECAQVQWRLLGLSIAEQTLLLFVLFFLLALWQMLRRPA